jgi:hypothetical protein
MTLSRLMDAVSTLKRRSTLRHNAVANDDLETFQVAASLAE